MKKMLPVALLLCLSFSLFSFAPVRHDAPVVEKSARWYTFPISGTTDGTPGQGQLAGTIRYEINGSGTTPSSITFKTLDNTVLGTYSFSLSSPNNYLAVGMKTQTSISGVYFHISNNCGTGYCLEFIGAA